MQTKTHRITIKYRTNFTYESTLVAWNRKPYKSHKMWLTANILYFECKFVEEKISSCDRYLIVLLLTLKSNEKQNILHIENYSFLYAQFCHYFTVKKLPMDCPLAECRHCIRRILMYFRVLQQVSYQCSINQNDCNPQYTQVYLAVRRFFFFVVQISNFLSFIDQITRKRYVKNSYTLHVQIVRYTHITNK